MQFEIGKQYQVTDAQGVSIIFECRAVQYTQDLILYPMPSYLVGYYSMLASIKCADVAAGLGNGCLALCVEMSGGQANGDARTDRTAN